MHAMHAASFGQLRGVLCPPNTSDSVLDGNGFAGAVMLSFAVCGNGMSHAENQR